MKKWTILYAFAAAAVIGCAGASDSAGTSGGATSTGGVDGRSVAQIALPVDVAPLIDTYLLPGQGRDAGSPTAVFKRFYYDDIAGSRAEDDLQSELSLKLDGFNAQNRRVNAPIPEGTPSRRFVDLPFEVAALRIDDGVGGYSEFPSSANQQPLINGNRGGNGFFPNVLSLTVFQGRTTALQLKINDAMLNINPSGDLVWDRNLFLESNKNPVTGKITGFISDYVQFDISSVASKPPLKGVGVEGTPAQRIYFSGDNIALSQGGSSGEFETLTPFGVFDGTFQPAGQPINKPTYELKQNDPRFIDPPRLITAVKGFFRPWTEVISNTGVFEFITFPKNTDGAKQDLAIVQRSVESGPITNMWFGEVDFGAGNGPSFTAWSIDQVQNATRVNPISGNLPKSLLKNSSGGAVDTTKLVWWRNVREGDFVFTTPPPGLATKYQTGRFVVFRR